MTDRKPKRATVHVETMFFLPEEAAAYLRLSPRTLANWRSSGMQAGPRYRNHGGVIVYEVSDLESWSLAHAVTGTVQRKAAADVDQA